MPETAVPGLWLVGDIGVYFMPNGDPPLKAAPGSAFAMECAFAVECERVRVKEESFGSDDGIIFLAAEDVEALISEAGDAPHIQVDLDPEEEDEDDL